MDLFDAAESRRLKDEGMSLAASNAQPALALARAIAVDLARRHGEVHADMVGTELEKRGVELGPASGSIFKGKRWQFTGKRVRSARRSNHARELKVWRLVQ